MHEKIPPLETEARDIPEFNLEEWQEKIKAQINEILLQKDKVIVNIAGASASGKGEAAEFLLQQLIREKRTLILSMDDFYKGISRMVTEKLSSYFPNLKINWREVENVVRNITTDKEFSEKFSEKNLESISKSLRNIFPNVPSDQIDQIISKIKNEFQNIDFDNPEAVDLDSLSKVLSKIKKNQEVEIPTYSMKISESGERKKINGADYDVILVEGIYGLNEKVAKQADIKTFIETDKRTLLMRRFRRDVLAGRASFPPEIALWITLEIVLPAYNKYILPDRSKSDLILRNDYTGAETFDTKTYDVQDKILVTETDIEQLEKFLGEPIEVKYQRDLYFTNEKETFNPQHLIRVREENGKLKDLIHKGTRIERDDEKIIRPTETYIREGEFGMKYKKIEEVLSAFFKAGFKLATEISKIRKIYKKDEIEIALDEIEGLGSFIEIKTNDKLSKSPAIDGLKQKLGLSGKMSVGPYADLYFAKIQFDPEKIKQQEIILNQGSSQEAILRSGACETIKINQEIESAFKNLREGYPESPLSEQCKGKKFRENADIILKFLTRKTLEEIDPQKVVLLMPWRSGLAFAKNYKKLGVNKFYHLSSKRDEETLRTIVDFESGEITSGHTVIISDPMLATGNTIIDTIERAVSKGASTKNIIINAVVAVPIGVQKIKKLYPEVKIIIGSLDEKLDHRGYIVPGLGDFGDKYFADLPSEELNEIVNQFDLDEEGYEKMINRIKKQRVSEVMTMLIERDLKDLEIEELNKKKLIEEGLEILKPKRWLTINTGRIEGVENVVGIIKNNVDNKTKIIAIEGKSGVGKSVTTRELKKALEGQIFSMGEIFRYLTYCKQKIKEVNLVEILNQLSYKMVDKNLKLFDGELNVTDELSAQLKDKKIESKIPIIARPLQKEVVQFSQKQIANFRKSFEDIILIEGRSFTLDFLPSDLRVRLVADPSMRAERRWAQDFFASQ